ncbi:ethanolamine ammonia-lyase reactivating factor EutA [Klebsiella pneumoniae]|nr:ethanolamine ammonia-lyase reactivating factor EutA [Klebsiella pneumoniae]
MPGCIDIGGGTSNYALFDAGNVSAPPASASAAACWKPTLRGAWSTRTRREQRIVDALFGAGTNAWR